MSDIIRIDMIYGSAIIDPVHACKIVGDSSESANLYEQIFEFADFVMEHGMDIMDAFEALNDLVESCL